GCWGGARPAANEPAAALRERRCTNQVRLRAGIGEDAFQRLASPRRRSGVRLTAGARVGPYEVLAALGAVGMGEVYRARDMRLARGVALKVISAGAAPDPERLQPFEPHA